MRKILATVALTLALAACGGSEAEPAAETEEAAATAEGEVVEEASVDSSGIDFGDDEGEWVHDDECDDPRFEGPGMTATPLLEADNGHDASDCLAEYEAGQITLREGA